MKTRDVLTAGLLLIANTAAFAQSAEAPSTAADTQELTEVVVTGTRLLNPNFTTPTPVQTITAETIENRAPAAIADVVNQVPAFRISRTATGSGRIADQQSGVQGLLDLRGLGANETLILINGRRTGATNANSNFDTNLIPVGLVERVDVVTGGASAAYGSDAVAGVVNFVLKNHYEGFSGSVQTGATEHGDGKQHVATFAGGTSFAGGKGHFIAGLDLATTKGVGNMYSREWGRAEPGLLALTAAQRAALGQPAQLFSNGVELGNVAPGSLIQGATTTGTHYAFDASGAPYLFNQTTLFGTGVGAQMTGSNANYGYNTNGAFKLQNPNDRLASYGRMEYALTDALTFYAEGNYGRTKLPEQPTGFYTTSFLYPRTSLPAALQSQYTGANVTLGRILTENGGGNTTSQSLTNYRGIAGFQGTLGNWKWEASYSGSRTSQDFNTSGLVTAALMKAVYGCNANTATNPNLTAALLSTVTTYEALTGKTCSVYNPIGNQVSSAALAYVYDRQHQVSHFSQDGAQVNFSGTPFELWAGDVSVAAGAEWRRNTLNVVGSLLGANNVFSQGNFGSYAGDDRVTEGFAEVGVPLAHEMAGVHSLDLDAAVRETDYKLSGKVTTWKGGLAYEPVQSVRLRVTQSRDIRAPNLSELFFIGGALPTANTVNNIPGTFGFGVSGTTIINGQGNPLVKPEKADTTTFGAAFAPTDGALSGLRLSADYYNIKVSGAIVRPNTAQSQNICAAIIAAGGTACPGITFSSTVPNGILTLSNISQNLNSLRVQGVDIEIAYTRSNPFGLPGKFTARALANRALHDQQVLTTGTFELAGSANGVPSWNGNLTVGYQNGAFGTDLQLTAFTGVKYDTTTLFLAAAGQQTVTSLAQDSTDAGYLVTNNSSISQNRFGGVAYLNWTAQYRVGEHLQLYGAVDNVLDREPPTFAGIAVTTGNRNLNYDLLGRSWRAGVRFTF
jgi:iron complex outermembrane receptor protein